MSVDLKAIAEISKKIASTRVAMDDELEVLRSLEMKNGQDFCTNLTVCGKKFQLVQMGRNYNAERVVALDVIRLELIKYQKGIVSFHKSALEGLEFRLREAASGRTA